MIPSWEEWFINSIDGLISLLFFLLLSERSLSACVSKAHILTAPHQTFRRQTKSNNGALNLPESTPKRISTICTAPRVNHSKGPFSHVLAI
jgi:hypothetical protein